MLCSARKNFFHLGFILATAMLMAPAAHAELDPELAAVGPKNSRQFFLGGNLSFGQSYATGGSSPDIAYKFSVEPGFVFPRDSWSRIEASLEFGFGQTGYTRTGGTKESVDMTLGLMALAKFGYGASMGSGSFLVGRFGLGPIMSSYKGRTNAGADFSSDDPIWGVATYFGVDFIAAMNDTVDFVGGLGVTHAQFNIDSVKMGGNTVNVSEAVNLNIPALQLGLRLTL